jgi:hypothetical protein
MNDDSINIIKLIQSVRNFAQLVKIAHEVDNHQTNHDENERDKENNSLNHAIEMIENLLQEARQQIASNYDPVDLANHADHVNLISRLFSAMIRCYIWPEASTPLEPHTLE